MLSIKRAVYFFCYDLEKDSVAPRVFDNSIKNFDFKTTNIVVDGYPVMEFTDSKGNIFNYVRTNEVISHDYEYYLPVMNKYFSDFDFGGVVNWHGGSKAPDKVLCLHTTGDVESGYFGMAHPIYTTNLAHQLEENRRELGLEDFRVTMEATHWSGVIYNGLPQKIVEYKVPLVDVEIGSTPESWANEKAVEVITLSLVKIFDNDKKVPTVLYLGGIHFEQPITNAVLNKEYPVSATHILPNAWLVNGKYNEEEGYKKLETCINSIVGGIDAIVYQEKLKTPFKEQCRRMAETLNIPAFKHKQLSNMKESAISHLYILHKSERRHRSGNPAHRPGYGASVSGHQSLMPDPVPAHGDIHLADPTCLPHQRTVGW